jgi:hypothetical protein
VINSGRQEAEEFEGMGTFLLPLNNPLHMPEILQLNWIFTIT